MNWPFITLMSIFEWVLKADINILKELFRNMSDILFKHWTWGYLLFLFWKSRLYLYIPSRKHAKNDGTLSKSEFSLSCWDQNRSRLFSVLCVSWWWRWWWMYWEMFGPTRSPLQHKFHYWGLTQLGEVRVITVLPSYPAT